MLYLTMIWGAWRTGISRLALLGTAILAVVAVWAFGDGVLWLWAAICAIALVATGVTAAIQGFREGLSGESELH